MEYRTEIIRSSRKSIGLEIRTPGVLLVRAPYAMTAAQIQDTIARHERWIRKHMEIAARRTALAKECDEAEHYTQEELQKMAQTALALIMPRVSRYANILGVTYGRITVRNQRTRWGSCSSKGNLNFNCLLTQVPEEVMDYVIVHELCHRLEMNHSQRFWNLVETVMPDYRQHRQWLKEHGGALIRRL